MISYRKSDILDRFKATKNEPQNFNVIIAYNTSERAQRQLKVEDVVWMDEHNQKKQDELKYTIDDMLDELKIQCKGDITSPLSLSDCSRRILPELVKRLIAMDEIKWVGDIREEEDDQHDAFEFNYFRFYITVTF